MNQTEKELFLELGALRNPDAEKRRPAGFNPYARITVYDVIDPSIKYLKPTKEGTPNA